MLLAALASVQTLPARASLGNRAASVAQDGAALSASSPSVDTYERYSVHTLFSPSVTVREYVSPSGAVFAVAWNGRHHPDLSLLLGEHYAEYRSALESVPPAPGRRHREVRTDHVVVQTWGHMRSLQGKAWLPALMPPGVTADDVR